MEMIIANVENVIFDIEEHLEKQVSQGINEVPTNVVNSWLENLVNKQISIT